MDDQDDIVGKCHRSNQMPGGERWTRCMYRCYENCSREEYIQMSELAQVQLREFARSCEVHNLDEVLTLNLRFISAHLTYQEMHLDPLRHGMSFGSRGHAKRMKSWRRLRSLSREVHCQPLEIACKRAISEGVRHVNSELTNEKKDTRPDRDAGKPGECFCSGTGTLVIYFRGG